MSLARLPFSLCHMLSTNVPFMPLNWPKNHGKCCQFTVSTNYAFIAALMSWKGRKSGTRCMERALHLPCLFWSIHTVYPWTETILSAELTKTDLQTLCKHCKKEWLKEACTQDNIIESFYAWIISILTGAPPEGQKWRHRGSGHSERYGRTSANCFFFFSME